MRTLIVIFCITGFLAKDIARLGWEIWFKVNQEQIIAEKCENKAKPMLHCNGKCYLSKQLEKLEQKEQNHNSKTNPFNNNLKFEYIPTPLEINLLFASIESKEKDIFQNNIQAVNEFSGCIFHPPSQIII
jgi:hypothetical protein